MDGTIGFSVARRSSAFFKSTRRACGGWSANSTGRDRGFSDSGPLSDILSSSPGFDGARSRSECAGPAGRSSNLRRRVEGGHLVAAGIIVDLAAIEHFGFILASIGLFWLTARAFDARHPLRDGALAVALSFAAYVVFARLLDLPLPPGLLAGLL